MEVWSDHMNRGTTVSLCRVGMYCYGYHDTSSISNAMSQATTPDDVLIPYTLVSSVIDPNGYPPSSFRARKTTQCHRAIPSNIRERNHAFCSWWRCSDGEIFREELLAMLAFVANSRIKIHHAGWIGKVIVTSRTSIHLMSCDKHATAK